MAGITYQMANTTDGAKNAVKAAGQTIKLPAGYTTLHLLAASTGGDKEATFLVDGKLPSWRSATMPASAVKISAASASPAM